STITPTDVSEREDEDELFSRRAPVEEDELPEFEWTKEQLDEIGAAPADDEEAEPAPETQEAEDEAEEEAAEPDDEEVPLFLSHKGKLLLFKSPEGLVEFIRSNAPHDLTQLKDWKKLVGKVKSSDVKADEGDTYELDLVVENLRGGPDAWDAGLV